ncbi:PREDICTED: uncharacterized protein LOC108361969 isoform X1 [Rhagoletis zephyria]|uniref:uncharacterized protein LOC108361969 isoform X1 n=1 Tax=Rhagoletis zephyria TaxID=28612 RepID=UPI00081122F3|nr:PREDICTED: uncharacterized protein LOC108361969 isoform X1 [Rhagoletis zephyria]
MGHMTLLNNPEEARNFIPHHCVTKADSSTTKLRVVFDASCRTSNGKSLNDILLVGPTLQDDIFTILLRFRAYKYVLMADIAKMYRQVQMNSADSPWQCILWRESPNTSVQVYKLQTVTYGTSSAPYLATKALQQLAKDEAKSLPIGSVVTLRDFYVDNLMTGGATTDEVVEIKQQVVELLKHGGFPLRKFATNDNSIISDIPQADREEIVQLGDVDYIKTLGLKWSPSSDNFVFSYTESSSSSKTTKRAILSQIASFFDPLGLLNPIIVSCKILMQHLWALKLDWDESVPQDVYTQWQDFRRQLSLVQKIQIPRYVPFNTATEIHAFADASTKAYGACIYMVTRDSNGTTSSLLSAKSRVAPKKEVSLPRLELCATLLLAELLKSIIDIFSPNPEAIHCWSDSTIALSWIKGEPSRWTVFVVNRVTRIQQLTSQFKWHHVTSADNPADVVSRGASAHDIIANSLWFHGPKFLLLPQEHWPRSSFDIPSDIPEQRCQRFALVAKEQYDMIASHKHITNFQKFLRIFTYVRWIIQRKRGLMITSGEIEATLEMVCKNIQLLYFRDEYQRMLKNLPLHRSSRLLQLAPFLHNQLIRVGGRIKNSTLAFNAKHPIVLPHAHPFIHTLITYYHRQHLHAGAQTLQNILRDKFWILNARKVIRQVIHHCIICYRLRPVVTEQIMGALPSQRISPSHPFETTGIDYCGPVLMTQKIRGRAAIKVYIAVFICFSTKAIHLEVVPDLSTAAFIAALKRFVARRGRCRLIYSDNATNFLGASRELRHLLEAFVTQQHINSVENFCREEGILWKFIPPRSPHFGGLWESAVKNAKHYLRRSIGNHILSYDELHTVVCQAEAMGVPSPLSPNHHQNLLNSAS